MPKRRAEDGWPSRGHAVRQFVLAVPARLVMAVRPLYLPNPTEEGEGGNTSPLLQAGEVGDRDAGSLRKIREGKLLLLAQLPDGWPDPLALFGQDWLFFLLGCLPHRLRLSVICACHQILPF